MIPRLPWTLAVLSAAAGLAACAGAAPGEPSGADGTGVAGRVSADGVTVVLRWRGTAPAPRLEATYTPDAAGFHLYSTGLPLDGVDGIGRPTRLEVGGGVTPAGAAVADRSVRFETIAGAGRPVPVYPAGPVTLTLPTHVAPGVAPRVWVSYAACSLNTCLAPVTHQAVDIAPPPPS